MKYKMGLGALVVLGAFSLGGGGLLAQRARQMTSDVGQDVQVLTNPGGWLGVRLEDVTAQKMRDLKLPGQYGALVTEVEPGSPAAKAGLQANDVIVDFAGDKVRSVAQLRRMVRETPVDRTVPVEIIRNGQRTSLDVTIEARSGGNELFGFAMPPGNPEMRLPPHAFEFTPPGTPWNDWFSGGTLLGIQGQDLTEQLAAYFGVKGGKGVLVAEVEKGSPAEKAGLRAGDCIIRVDSKEVTSVGELHEALADAPRGQNNQAQVTLTIVRDRHEQSLPVTLAEHRRMIPMMESIYDEDASGRAADMAAQAEQLRAQLQEKVQDEYRASSAAALAQLESQLEATRRQLKDQNSELHKAMEEARRQMQGQQKELLRQLQRELSGVEI